jgi:hypothetical protein
VRTTLFVFHWRRATGAEVQVLYTPQRCTVRDTSGTTSLQARPRRSHIFDRAAHDWYLEPHSVSERLFDVEAFDRDSKVLDPCTGTGRIADAAKAAGYRVITGDIVDRGYRGCRIQDFLQRKSAPASIVGNPPFDDVEAFVRHAMAIGANKIAFVFVVQRLNAAHWLWELPLRRIWLLTPRPSMPPGAYVLAGGKVEGDRKDYCWLIFERGYRGKPELRWLLHRVKRQSKNSRVPRSAIGREKKAGNRSERRRPSSSIAMRRKHQ